MLGSSYWDYHGVQWDLCVLADTGGSSGPQDGAGAEESGTDSASNNDGMESREVGVDFHYAIGLKHRVTAVGAAGGRCIPRPELTWSVVSRPSSDILLDYSIITHGDYQEVKLRLVLSPNRVLQLQYYYCLEPFSYTVLNYSWE